MRTQSAPLRRRPSWVMRRTMIVRAAIGQRPQEVPGLQFSASSGRTPTEPCEREELLAPEDEFPAAFAVAIHGVEAGAVRERPLDALAQAHHQAPVVHPAGSDDVRVVERGDDPHPGGRRPPRRRRVAGARPGFESRTATASPSGESTGALQLGRLEERLDRHVARAAAGSAASAWATPNARTAARTAHRCCRIDSPRLFCAQRCLVEAQV